MANLYMDSPTDEFYRCANPKCPSNDPDKPKVMPTIRKQILEMIRKPNDFDRFSRCTYKEIVWICSHCNQRLPKDNCPPEDYIPKG